MYLIFDITAIITYFEEININKLRLLAAGSILGMNDIWRDSPHPFLSRIEWNEDRLEGKFIRKKSLEYGNNEIIVLILVMSDVMDVDSLWRASSGRKDELIFIGDYSFLLL